MSNGKKDLKWLMRRTEIKPGCTRSGESAPFLPPRGGKQMRALLCCLLGLITGMQAAQLRVIDETAIPFMSFLSRADFDQRYPGTLIGMAAELDSGWYVIYEHESLNYYFGPIVLRSIGQDYLEQLTETVESAVAERPTIQDYRLELSYEPTEAGTTDSADENRPPDTTPSPNPAVPPPEPKPSFWGLIKRVFGFG